ncbi:MAG TPA: DUF3795 domain-containing protein [Spirochaetota bacterium]|nr:DUF3795 domain-containing protein [Spirochaetota bacterium]
MKAKPKTNAEDLANSIAYCGLICKLCFLKDSCDGCKSKNNLCDRNLADKGCFQKQCCTENNYEGCWECESLYSCTEGIYSLGDYSKIKAFAICIREDGKDKFINYILENTKKGWSVEKDKDYDGKKIDEVLEMLRG